MLSQKTIFKNFARSHYVFILFLLSSAIFLISLSGCSDQSAKNSKNSLQSGRPGEIASSICKAKYIEEIFIPDTIRLSIPSRYSLAAIHSLNISSNKNIVLIEFNSEIVLYFDSTGNFIKKIGGRGKGPGEFTYPRFCGFDKDGKIFIGDFSQRKISIFDKYGDFSKSFLVNNMIGGMLVFSDGQIVINDQELAKAMDHETIFMYSDQGNLLKKFGSPSSGMKELKNLPIMTSLFKGPYLTVYDNHIFETDYVDYHIKKYDMAGNFIMKFGEEPKHWNSVLNTNYRQMPAPQMVTPEVMKKIDKFFVEFGKHTIIEWLTVLPPGIIVSMSQPYINDNAKNIYFSFYDLNGNLLNNGLAFKNDKLLLNNFEMQIKPLAHGFCLIQFLTDISKETTISEGENQIIKLIIFN